MAFDAPWKLAALLLAIVAAWRGVLLLGAAGGRGPWMVAHFVFMAALPFVFLTREGRIAIGLRRPSRPRWLLWGPLLGALAAIVIGLIALLLFEWSPDNWYVSFGQTMLRDHRLAGLAPVTLAITLGIPAAVFSPVGEELFFRGLLHTAIETVAGRMVALVTTAVSFGVIHLFHHGLALTGDGIQILAVSGSIWLVLVMGLSLLFTLCRTRSGSIWPSVASHAAFNVAMVIFIVFLWPR